MLVIFRRFSTYKRLPPLTIKAAGYTTAQPYARLRNQLLPGLKLFVEKPHNEPHVDAYIHKQLDKHLPSTPNPAVTYAKVIDFLVDRRLYTRATSVYERMIKENVAPRHETSVQMVAVALTLAEFNGETDAAWDAAFLSDQGFSHTNLSRILLQMLIFGASHTYVASIKDRLVARPDGFTPSQPLVTKLVDAQVRAGRLKAGLATMTRHANIVTTTRPYTAAITALRDTSPLNPEPVKKVLDFMKSKNIAPDIFVFNTLLSRELWTREVPKLISLYEVLKSQAQEGLITPDATTFSILFTALLIPRQHIDKQTGNYEGKCPTITPRSVFHDMMVCHKHAPIKMNINLMNVAIRTLMDNRDYAGAFIALRSFPILKVNVSPKTYNIIIRHIIRRLRRAIDGGTGSGFQWPLAFLGMEAVQFKKLDVNDSFVNTLLAYTRAGTFDIHRGVLEPRPPAIDRYITPTLSMMGQDVSTHKFSELPLLRILRRAMFGSAPSLSDPESHMLEIIKQAKAEMVCV
jgi:pentatricopeptide repeat protein